jgi:hypothetical protein
VGGFSFYSGTAPRTLTGNPNPPENATTTDGKVWAKGSSLFFFSEGEEQ